MGKLLKALRAQLNKIANLFFEADPIAVMQLEVDQATEKLKEGRKGLEMYRGLVETVARQVAKEKSNSTQLESQIKAHLKAGNREVAGQLALQLQKVQTELATNEQQLQLHEQAYQNNLLKIQKANKDIVKVREKIRQYDAELKMSAAEAEIAQISESFDMDVTTDFGQIEAVIQKQIDTNRGRARVAVDMSSKGIEAIKAEEAAEKAMAEDLLSKYEVQLGLKSPETSVVVESAKNLGPTMDRTTTRRSTMASGRPRPAFFLVMLLIIGGLIYFGVSRFGGGMIGGDDTDISADELATQGGPEAPDDASLTTVKEYTYVPGTKLPEVRGTSAYEPLANNTVRMALNVWAGWAPVILANNGFAASKVWNAPGGKTFKLELVLIDDPIAMRDAYASGKVHIGWATLDMIPLFVEQLRRDSRTMPRVYQQIDWSNGGDGIVCRNTVRSVTDMRGKTVVLAQNSPSHYFLLNTLISGGLQPGDVKYKFTQDAFQAAAAFNADRSVSCVVSWAPDIYNLSEASGNRMLVNTQTANKLIADVWFARADFAKDNGAIIEGLVRGIFEAMEKLKTQESKAQIARLMATGYSIPETDALSMLADAHATNYAENREFFLNQNNPTNFERTWNTAYFLYRKIGSVTGNPVPFDQVMDFSIMQKLGSEPFYANQKNEYQVQFVPTTAATIQAESDEILTKTIVIQFYPNSDDIEKKVDKAVEGRTVQELYDPHAPFVVEEAGKMSGQFGAARIVIEGHTDASMRNSGLVTPTDVQELSLRRANAVKQALIRKFPTLEPNQFTTVGRGWDRPADPNDAGNHAKNRRVEIKVYPLEAR